MPLFDRNLPRRDGWPPTLWGVVAALDRREHPDWQASWRTLVEGYTAPMEAYARRVLSRWRGQGVDAGEAAEVVQDFLVRCVEKGWLSQADPQKGQFRVYLQALLRRHVGRLLRHATAQKRRPEPGRALLPLDDEAVAGDAGLQLDDAEDRVAFDREWVAVVVQRARERLRARNARYGDVIDDLVVTGGEGSHGLAERLHLREEQLPVLRHRARTRLREFVLEELRATVSDPEAFEEEWRALAPYLP
ncbi:MAG: hypothetical protein ACKOSS_07645 [Planctomycetia bacterium]